VSHLRARCQDMFSRFSVGGVCNVLTVNPTTLRSRPKKHLISADAAVASLAFWATRTYLPLYEVFGAVTFRSLASRSCLNRGPFSCGIVRGRAFACRCRAKCHLQSVAGRARSIHTSRNRRSGATRQEFRANDARDWDLQYLPLSAPGPE